MAKKLTTKAQFVRATQRMIRYQEMHNSIRGRIDSLDDGVLHSPYISKWAYEELGRPAVISVTITAVEP